jgi:hypothetical protein
MAGVLGFPRTIDMTNVIFLIFNQHAELCIQNGVGRKIVMVARNYNKLETMFVWGAGLCRAC